MMLINEIYRLSPVDKEKEVGIEIEVEGDGILSFNYTVRGAPIKYVSHWDSKGDGSLRGNSIEYVLVDPAKRSQVKYRLRNLQATLNDRGVELAPSDRCGVHVHLNCQHLTFDEVMRIVCLYIILEIPLTRYCGEFREGNLFCLRAVDAEMLIDALVQAQQHGNFHDFNSDTYRYAGINIASIQKFGTLEFRSLQTPKNLEDIAIWVDMLLRIKDTALSIEHLQEMVTGLSMRGAKEFLDMVFGPLANKLYYKGANNDLFTGVRLMQEIAYTPRLKEVEKKTKRKSEGPMPGTRWVIDESTHTRPQEVAIPPGATVSSHIPSEPIPIPEETTHTRINHTYITEALRSMRGVGVRTRGEE